MMINKGADIPNRIKQPSMCCVYCGKSYERRANLNKHVIVCEVINKTKNKKSTYGIEGVGSCGYDDDVGKIPSPKEMYEIIVFLTNKCNNLEKKVDDMSRIINSKKKKINIAEWLNNNFCKLKNNEPLYSFSNLINEFIVNIDDIEYLFNNNIYDTLHNSFVKNTYRIFGNNIDNCCLFSTTKKPGLIYVYDCSGIMSCGSDCDGITAKWVELSNEMLRVFLNKHHFMFIKSLSEWKKENQKKMNECDSLSEKYNKTIIKLMSCDFKQETSISKMKGLIYNFIKKDIIQVEYEF